MRQTRAVHMALKQMLRKRSLTYADVAGVIDVSESSVKRLFSKNQLSLQRIEQICDWMNIDFVELADLSRRAEKRLTHLSDEQERSLLADPKLFLVAYMLVNQWTESEITELFDFDETDMIQMLAKLDRMGLIELLPLNRVRLLTARNFAWNPKGPVAEYVRKVVLKEFLHSTFTQPGEKMEFVSGMLSRAAILKMHELMREQSRKFDDLVFEDLKLPASERFGVSLLSCIRPWEFSKFTEYRKGPITKSFASSAHR